MFDQIYCFKNEEKKMKRIKTAGQHSIKTHLGGIERVSTSADADDVVLNTDCWARQEILMMGQSY